MLKRISKKSTPKTKTLLLIIILVLVLLSSSLIYIVARPKTSETPQNTQDIKGVTATILPQPKADPIWWDMNWKSAKRISLTNISIEAMQAGKSATVTFDHKQLVDLNRSDKDGRNLRLVFQNTLGEVKPIDFQLESPNSKDSTLYFNTVERIESGHQVFNYFLYFDNQEVAKNEFLNTFGLKIQNDNIKAEIGEDISLPFTSAFNRKWILKGNNLSADYKYLTGTVNFNKEFNLSNVNFSWEVENTNLKSVPSHISQESYKLNIDPSELKPGDYNLILKLGNYKESYPFKVSYPLYMTWTIDWEGMDVKDEYLGYMDKIATDNGMPMTHFFSPRIYTLSSINESRRKYLTDWVKNRAAKYGDSIDMHLHMHYDFVEKSGVAVKKDVSWSGFKDGYDVPTSVYTAEELEKIVSYGLQLFEQNGLKKPVGYRAGGWHIKLEGLAALEKLGFKYDSSGRESFTFGNNKMAVPWSLRSTSQPYQISLSDQNSSKAPTMNLWEFPNNGSDSTNYPVTEMLGKYKANYTGSPLKERQVVTFLSHPQWFKDDKPRMEELFSVTNKELAKDDNGPVIYVTLDEVYNIWTKN